MFFTEIRRKYFNIVFLVIVVIGGFWLYSVLKPESLTSYNYYKYNYFKPLTKAEFVYFELVSDYKRGITVAFFEPKGNGMWGTYERTLNSTEREYFIEVIKKINPSYKDSEKMKDASINLSYSQMRPYLKELEEKLKIYSLYYTGIKSNTWHNCPYRIYKNTTWRFRGRKYKDALNDFLQTYENGISNGYARLFLDNAGTIICLIAIIYSASYYTEEKKAKINGYIYTSNITSIKFVLYKYLANIVPLMLLSIIYAIFGAACFIYWNYKFNYGYSISIIPFIVQTPLIIFPAVLITTATGHMLGIVFESGAAVVIIQFALFILDSLFGEWANLNKITRYYDFDNYSYYREHSGSIFINRIIIAIFSIILIALVVKLFDYRREHNGLINFKRIKKSVAGFWYKIFKLQFCKNKEYGKQKIVTRSFGYYIFKQSLSKTALLYIPYLCIMYLVTFYQPMNTADIAMAGEAFLVFASIFLFIRLGNMEQANGTESYVFTSNSFYPFIYMSRVAAAGIVLFIMVEIPVLFLCLLNHAQAGRWCIGVYLSSLFIGMLALLVTEVFGNYLLGYFLYIMYCLFDGTLAGDMPLSLSGYTYGIKRSKLYLAVAIIVIVVVLTIIIYNKSKGIKLIKKYKDK